ncbi:type II toxin-antitoxin system VapC family toxin [Gordonia mangrovi]|uniref:type II toxin-antitoxin system VapC family toxin n=1 Tax=Gordonia mangrovi TaxID=2665643 RepID=UPI002D7F11AA|nr:type II toxin-antitoxin system VapC family toxin [Gordonia mangrovi]
MDTSAAMKLIVDEPESEPLLSSLTSAPARRLIASWLLHAELHCAAGRYPDVVSPEALSAVLATIDLIDLTRGDMIAAGTYAPLRSHDAIHLAVAIRVGADDFLTYDDELAARASRAGLRALSPR